MFFRSSFPIAAIAVISSILTVSCQKEQTPRSEEIKPVNRIHLCVNVTKDIPSEQGVSSKVSYDWMNNSVEFESDDSLQILIGKWRDSTTLKNVDYTCSVLPMTSPGVFEGTIDLGSYSLNDIHGAVIVKEKSTTWRVRDAIISGNHNLGISLPVLRAQTQDNAGEFIGGKDGRFPFYSFILPDQIHDNGDGNISIDKLDLKMGCTAFEYHIYGAGRSDEKVTNVEIATYGSGATGSIALVPLYSEVAWARRGVYTNYYHDSNVTLATPASVPSDKANAVLIWHHVYGKYYPGKTASTHPVKSITVTTDAAVYTREWEEGDLNLNAELFQILPVYLNIGTDGSFSRTVGVEYSIDSGNSWTDWTAASSSLPSESADSLKVRTHGAHVLTEDKLSAIKTWMNSQSKAINLDLSDCTYEDTTFPATFTQCTNIKSIKFPNNVKALAAKAFYKCTNLTSVDLDGLTSISTAQGQNYAFAGSGLTSVTIPASISSFMDRSFVNCKSLTEIHYAASWSPGTGYNYRTFQWGEGTSETNAAHTHEMTLYIESNVKNTPQSGFYCNNNLTRVVVEGDDCVLITKLFYGCRYLAKIELKGSVPPKIYNTNVYTNMGESVEESDRKVIIPHGATETYSAHANWAAWETMMTNRKYTVEEAAE